MTLTKPTDISKVTRNATNPLTTTLTEQFQSSVYLSGLSSAPDCVVSFAIHEAPGGVVAPSAYTGSWVKIDLASGAFSLKEFEIGYIETVVKFK